MKRIKKDEYAGIVFGALVGLMYALQKTGINTFGYAAAKKEIKLQDFIMDLRIATIELKEWMIDEKREGKK